jgi:hypothetical protein
MAFTSLDNLVAALPGQIEPYTKSTVTSVAGGYQSLWNATGQPGAGVIAISQLTTGVIPTSATAGGFSYTNNGGGAATTNVARLSANSSSAGTLVLYDRLWHGGSFTAVNGSISITNPTTTPNRLYGPSANYYQGFELWFEVASALSATGVTITVTYVDGIGGTGLTATSVIPASAILGRMFPFVMANQNGIQYITALSGSAGPTGTFNLVILQRLIEAPMAVVGVPAALDFAGCGFPLVKNSACLAMFMVCNAVTTGTLSGIFNLVTN